MKLLIVDDSRAMRMIVKRTLNQAGYGGHEIIEASNGVEALEAIEQHTPDVVLSDYNMPEMNGGELLRELRSRGNETPFGFITSESSVENREMAEEHGASFMLTKPFTPESFAQHLDPVLA